MEKREIFGRAKEYDLRIRFAKRAVSSFSFQCSAARAAVDSWCLIARRLNNQINKDIRKKIGMLIWEARHLAEYAQVHSKTEQKGCAIS